MTATDLLGEFCFELQGIWETSTDLVNHLHRKFVFVPHTFFFMNWRTFHQKRDWYSLWCGMPTAYGIFFSTTRDAVSGNSNTEQKGCGFMVAWHNRHVAANVPCINMWSSFKTTNVDTLQDPHIEQVMMSLSLHLKWEETNTSSHCRM